MRTIAIVFFLFLIFYSQTCFTQSQCYPGSKSRLLDINNVKARYDNRQFFWFDNFHGLSSYEVPQNSNWNPTWLGAIVWGAKDEDGNILESATPYYNFGMTTGPINKDLDGNIIASNPHDHNHIYKINRNEVVLHRLYFSLLAENDGVPPNDPPFENGYNISEDILNWPAHAEVISGQPQELAPYFDNDCCGGTPGIYEPELGDYPAFRFPDNEDDFDCEKHLLGDQVLWWVLNDAGCSNDFNDNHHSFGFEIQMMAYAFVSSDHLNNTTFLRKKFINRSDQSYHDMYIGMHMPSPLGTENYYMASHVEKGMMYYYFPIPEDEIDPPYIPTMGPKPPAIGFTWVGGPLADENDGLDNNYNGIIDEPGERLRMDHSNYTSGSTFGNSIYESLSGQLDSWMDIFSFEFGQDADSSDIYFKMRFHGDSDPLHLNTYGTPVGEWWAHDHISMMDFNNFMSSGPFTFQSDSVKTYTLAIPWAHDATCTDFPCSIDYLLEANDLAQQAHDNCYIMNCQVIDVVFNAEFENSSGIFSSPITSGIAYHWDFGDGIQITTDFPFANHQFESVGNLTVCLEIDYGCGSSSSCKDIALKLSELLPGPEITQIEGTGNTRHFFELTEETIEAILNSDSNMVVHPTYKGGKGPVKIMAYNLEALVEGEYRLQFDGIEADSHWKMYRIGSTDTVYSDFPIVSEYIQYIEQWGLMISVDALPNDNPISPTDGVLHFENGDVPWLTHVPDIDGYTYQNWIREGNVYVDCLNSQSPCYENSSFSEGIDPCFFNDRGNISELELFEDVLSGGWTPSIYTTANFCHPYFNLPTSISSPHNAVENTRNVDIVLTPDKSQWSRCHVLDLNYGPSDTFNGNHFRTALSVDKNGRNQNHPNCNIDEATYFGQQVNETGLSYGMGWFPGYAIDVNTGKRLNILFGENPDLLNDNGNDMIWNPTSKMWNDDGSVCFGGSHAITILSNHFKQSTPNNNYTGAAYDGGQSAYDIASPLMKYQVLRRQQQWTGLPILNEGFELLPIEEGLIPTKTTIQLRLRHRYQNYLPGEVNINNGNPLYNFTIDYEDLISNVEEVSQEQKILLYPNPAKDQLHVQLFGFDQQLNAIQIYTLSGRLVKSETLHSNTQSTIDISSLPNGVYIMRVGSADGEDFLHKRFVVVR